MKRTRKTGNPEVRQGLSLVRFRWLVMLATGLLVAMTLAPQLRGQVLKTEQTQCWNDAGTAISCTGTGQDGELQIGVMPNYTDNGDGTITDNVTGLMWEKLDKLTFAGNPSDIHDAGNKYATWDSAFGKIADLNAANFAGYSDWRLPNVNELRSLIFYGREAPAVDPAFYNGTDSFTYITGNYWSSTSEEGSPFSAIGVSFTAGASSDGPKTSATLFFVRAVRGPVKQSTAVVLKTGQTQCWNDAGTLITCAGTGQDGELQIGADRSYKDNGDGTITDNSTGLVWEELDNLDGNVDSGDLHDADNNYTDWDLAFGKIVDLNAVTFAGHSDWRLPNIKELETLKDFGKLDVATIDTVFNNGTNSFTRPNGYWSSTTAVVLPTEAQGETFNQGGGTFFQSKTNPFANGGVRAVRGPVVAGPVIVPPTEISTTASGLLYSRVSKSYTGTVTIKNISGSTINGPLEIAFTSLPSGVTLANATGNYSGNPYITVSSVTSLAPGQSATINVQFADPSLILINFTPIVYSGSLN